MAVNWDKLNQAKQDTKVVGYGRVSTKDQVDKVSLAAQQEKIENYSTFQDYNLVDMYVDKGISGAKYEERKELQRMLKDAEKGVFDLLIVYSPDRLSRTFRGAVEVMFQLEDLGVGIAFLNPMIDTRDEVGKMIFTFMGHFAEMDRKNITERLTMGRQDKVRQGFYIGKKPYGYNVENGKLYINEEEAQVVDQIFKWSAYNGYTLRKIASELNELGVLPPSTRSSQWSFNTVSTILKNELYYGEYIYKGEKINLEFEEIISKSIFMRANKSKRKGE